MPIKIDPFVFTGTQEDLTCYVCRGRNILRKRTSLDAERVKKDPAFKGFRGSSNRMRRASPIAASLYAMVPAKHREYPLYRVLTGGALRLLKQGLTEDAVKIALQKEHIEPLIERFLRARRFLVEERPKGSSGFSYGRLQINEPVRKTRRIRQRRHVNYSMASLPVTNQKSHVRFIPMTSRKPPPALPAPAEIPGLIFLGRIDDARRLKMYQYEDIGFIIGLNATPSVVLVASL